MRKSTRVLKRLLSMFLVVLISINSYAAIVGDNDGAAFVTKAEFDSLRNTFDAQINQYNSSIDNKIDGAIGSYLAGVKTNDKPYIMLDDVKGAIGRDLRFQNSISQGSALTTRYIVNKEKTYSLKYADADQGGWFHNWDQDTQFGKCNGGWKLYLVARTTYAGSQVKATVMTIRWANKNIEVNSGYNNNATTIAIIMKNKPTTHRTLKYTLGWPTEGQPFPEYQKATHDFDPNYTGINFQITSSVGAQAVLL